MFLRLKKTDSGQVLKMVESFRDPEGIPRHRTVVSLGNPDIAPEHYKIISRMVDAHFKNSPVDLFDSVDATDEIRAWVDRIIRQIENEKKWNPQGNKPVGEAAIVTVNTETVSHEQTSELGPVLVGLNAWNELGFDDVLKACDMPDSRIHAAKVSVINRLVDPVAESSLLDWYRSVALGDIVQEKLLGSGDDRFYRASDSLLKNQEKIEVEIRKKTQALHNPDRTILLYDLTNTHFEGVCDANPKAMHGKNKQGRSDCPQVVIGMIFDTSGFELGHHMFSGNQSDSTSLPTMLETMKRIAGKSENGSNEKVLVVMDAGLSSAANLAAIRDAGYTYLVNDRRPLRKRYKEEFFEKDAFELISGRDGKTPVYVRHLTTETELDDGAVVKEQILLCRSDERGEKEKAILSTVELKFIDLLTKLQRRIEKGRIKSQSDADKALGKLSERYSRVYRYYTISADVTKKTLVWSTKEENRSDADSLCGGYVLRTNDMSIDKDTIWKTYIALTKAENGFRVLKGNLGLRPNFHQKEGRVDGHVFITVLAYQLLTHILAKLEREGDFRCWETIRRILKTHAYTTMIIPEIGGKVHRIRKAGNPDESQKAIYNSLGINWRKLPKWHVCITPKSEE